MYVLLYIMVSLYMQHELLPLTVIKKERHGEGESGGKGGKTDAKQERSLKR